MKITYKNLECEADFAEATYMMIRMFESSVEDIKEYKDFTEKEKTIISEDMYNRLKDE